MFDTSRFFDVRSLERYRNSSSSGGGVSISQLQNQEYIKSIIESLMSECCQEPSHEDERRQHRRKYGTLYCGSLGPQTFVRMKWVKMLPDEAQRRDLLRQAKKSAEYALLDCSSSQRTHRFVVTLLEGKWVGAMCMLAVVENQLGHLDVARRRTEEVVRVLNEDCSQLPPEECEVLYGRAGAMQAILFVRRECNDVTLGMELVVRLATEILLQGRHEARLCRSKMSLLWQWHGKHYLGAAHGVVGILHTLLQLSPGDWASIEQHLAAEKEPMFHPLQIMQESLQVLTENFCMPSGNLQSSTSSESDRLVHFCHGAPGLCMLLLRAAKVFPEPAASDYIQLAANIAETVVWPRGLLRKGVGLCHGISGNAYVFLKLSEALQATDKSSSTKWKDRALLYVCFALNHLRELKEVPDRPLSLYEGMGGLICFVIDSCLSTSESYLFPLYDFGW